MATNLPLQSSFEALQSQFKIMKECPACEKSFTEGAIHVIETSELARTMHITCPHCKHALVILIGITEFGAGVVGMMTDLSLEDAYKVKEKVPFTDNELLDHYEVLYNGHGELERLVFKK